MAFDKILILDDEMIVRKSLEAQLVKRGLSVSTAETLAEAEALLAEDRFDLAFVDVRLPDGEGTSLLEHLADQPEAPMVVIITGFGKVESAVECMRRGAFDYVVKPFSKEHIEIVLKKAEAFSQMVKLNRHFTSHLKDDSDILGNSQAVKRLRQMVRRVAGTGATVLVTGENGTGKELIAKEIWRLSPLAQQSYITVNCAAISESLIESEFFGHERGAFTGAVERRIGRFELANNGTILLDEIGEIPLQLQAKLLRVLQEQEFERVGGNRTIKVNVRVIATTNRNLEKAVEAGEFRQDLFYRLNVFPIHVPALRERHGDVLLLAKEFLKKFARQHGISTPGFSEEAEQMLATHIWPGNVRELQNSVERAVILTEDGEPVGTQSLGLLAHPQALLGMGQHQQELSFDASQAHVVLEPEERAVPATLEELEQKHILGVLDKLEGNRTKAAEVLAISIRTLRNKLNQYREQGLPVPGDK